MSSVNELTSLCRKFERLQKEQIRLREESKVLKKSIMGYVKDRVNGKAAGPFLVKVKRSECYKPLTSVKILMRNLDLSKEELCERGLVSLYYRKTLEIKRKRSEDDAMIVSSRDNRHRRRLVLD